MKSTTTTSPQPTAQRTQPVQVLLVEDSPHDLKLTMRAFKKHNLENTVQVARDGAEALEILIERARRSALLPKMVLLDLKLPKIDGIEVLRRIRAHPQLHQLPVVLLTTSRQGRDIAQAYELGCNSYIVKPFDFKEFTDVILTLGSYWLVLNTPPSVSAGSDGLHDADFGI